MKRLIATLLAALLMSVPNASAESGWSIRTLLLMPSLRDPIYLSSVNLLDGGEFGIAIGWQEATSVPIVATTDDGGRQWVVRNLLVAFVRLFKVEFVDQTTAIAVGNGIYRTIDRGVTWSRVSNQSARGVSFENADAGTAVGDGGTILRTTDGGLSWARQSGGTTSNLYDVSSFDSSSAVAVGDSGIILRTIDGGATWTLQASGAKDDLRAVSFATASIGTIVGLGGTILRTTDGGNTWTRQMSGTSAPLLSVAYVDGGNTAIVGGGGTILRTTDAGTTWREQQLPPGPANFYWSGVSVKGANGVAVGFLGSGGDSVILHTATEGEPVICTTGAPKRGKAP